MATPAVTVAAMPAPVPVGKAGWRACADARLRALQPPQRKTHAAVVAREVLRLAQERDARRVGLYSPVGAEVETRDLANALLAHGIALVYPRLRPDGQAMDFADCAGPAALAPRPRSRLLEPTGAVVAPEELDLLLVPTVAVRGDLTRLGRGGGHYDRYLPQLRDDALLVGAVPQACVLDWSPVEDHDRRLHLVCTELGLFAPAA